MDTKHRSQDEPININNELPQRQAAEYVSAYSNYVQIGTSAWDFRFLFFDIEESETGDIIREKKACVVMSPQFAKAFSQVLNSTIERWDKEPPSE